MPKLNILILDVYPKRNYRISKDTNGGYGTANDYGDTLIPKLLSYAAKNGLDWPPLYSVYAAGALRAAGHKVDYCRDYDGKTYDLCLLPTSMVAHETELSAARSVSNLGIPVAAIGPFANTMSQAYLEAGAFVVRGEPEMFFHNFSLTKEEISELGPYCSSDQIIDLDDLAYPAWDIILHKVKTKNNVLSFGKKSLPILATRGCPYSCAYYCVYPLQQGNKVRSRAPEKIVAEMRHWRDTLGIRNFVFRDPVFSINQEHTVKLCDVLEEANLGVNFLVETHLQNIGGELGKRLYDVGLRIVYVGVESGSKDVMEDAKRFSIELEEEKNRIRQLENIGIKVQSMFIIGFPTDTLESCRKTINFAKDLCTAYSTFRVFTPYPGTPVFAEYENRVTTSKFEDFTQWNLVFDHPNLSSSQIRSLLNKAHTEYYSNPKWIGKFIRKLFG